MLVYQITEGPYEVEETGQWFVTAIVGADDGGRLLTDEGEEIDTADLFLPDFDAAYDLVSLSHSQFEPVTSDQINRILSMYTKDHKGGMN